MKRLLVKFPSFPTVQECNLGSNDSVIVFHGYDLLLISSIYVIDLLLDLL